MRLPRGELLLWGSVLLGGAIYLLVTLPGNVAEFQFLTALFAGFVVLVALLLMARFRWSPELFVALPVFVLGFALYRLLTDGWSKTRIVMLVAPLLAFTAYPSLRRAVRGQEEEPWPDEEMDERDAADVSRPGAAEEDSSLCGDTCRRIMAYHGDAIDLTKLNREERNVLLAYNAMGTIGDGGFNYLFESGVPGDPQYSLTAAAFEDIGSGSAAQAFRRALSLFPGSRPPEDHQERMRLYRSGDGTERHEIDCAFFNADDEIIQSLDAYIRSHPQAFAHLEDVHTERPQLADMVDDIKAGRRKYVEKRTADGPSLETLPHWARVAFAARCGRRVLPLFHANWPNAPAKRVNGVVTALELAEQSAAAGRASEGLEEATTQAIATAGAALNAIYGFLPEEPAPPDGNMGATASYVAKVAEHAAGAAQAPAAESVESALEAYTFALDLASHAPNVREEIQQDLAFVCKLAAKRKWTDKTPLPPAVWDAQRS
jgi:hypothetical protein